MQTRTPILERAFALARSGACISVAEIRARLKSEGYTLVEDFIAGKKLLSELKALCARPAVPLDHGAGPV